MPRRPESEYRVRLRSTPIQARTVSGDKNVLSQRGVGRGEAVEIEPCDRARHERRGREIRRAGAPRGDRPRGRARIAEMRRLCRTFGKLRCAVCAQRP